MKRPALWIPVLLLSLTAGLVTVLIHTETGLHWSFRLVQAQLTGQLEAQRLSGRLSGPLEIGGLRYRDETVDVRIGRIALDWRPWSLLAGRVVIRELIIEDSDITIAGTAREKGDAQGLTALEDLAFSLPVPIAIDRLDIRSATLRLPDQDPLTLDRLGLRARARDDGITIEDFHFDADFLAVEAEGRLPLSSNGPLRIAARFRATVDGQAWSGTTILAGTPAAIDARLAVEQPIGVLGEAQLHLLADPPHWQAAAGVDPFSLDVVVPESRPVKIRAAEIEAEGRGTTIDITGHLAAADDEFGSWGVDLDGRVDGPRREIHRFVIRALEGDARIEGRAAHTAGDEPGAGLIEVDLHWINLAWPPAGEPQAFGPQGSANLSGAIEDYRFTLAGTWLLADLPPLDLALEGSGNTSGLDVRELRADFLGGNWNGTGMLEWRPAPRWALSLTASDIDPGSLHPELAGRLDGQMDLNGGFHDVLALDIGIGRLGGTLRGLPFDSHAHIVVEDTVIDVRELFVHAGGIEINGAARFDEQWNVDWRLDSTDLGVLHPDLRGTVQSTGTVTGPPDALRLWLALDAEALSWLEHGTETLTLSADLGLGVAGQWQAALIADGARVAGHELGRITLDTEGSAPDHRITLRVEHDNHSLYQQLSGALGDGRWSALLNQGRIEEARAGAWSQQTDTRLEITTAGASLGDFCWQQDAAVVCLRGDRDAKAGVHARLDWRDLELSLFDPWLPDERAGITGSTRGVLEIGLEQDGPGVLRLDIRSTAGALRFPLQAQGEIHTLGFESIVLTALAEEPLGLTGSLEVILNDQERMEGEIHLPAWRLSEPMMGPEQALHGSLGMELHDLSVLSMLLPDLQTGPGRIAADVRASGTVGAPRIDGDLQLTLDHLALVRFGVRLDELLLDADIRHNDWTLAGGARMGQGRLELAGHGTAHSAGDWRGEISLNGEDLMTLQLPTAEVITSPAITVRANQEELAFNGTLRIPRARIEPVAPESVEPLSGDVVIIGEIEPEEAPPRIDTHGQIELVLGDQVRVIGKGFDGRLTGRLLVILERDGSLNGQGEIRVADGRYRAYGQNLSISQGRMLYAGGPLDNPAIDIIASRMRGEIEVGVRVTGTAEQPQVALFSSPAMDDADVLSYLVLGRPMDQAGEGDGQLLHQAATSVALVGGEAIAERISERFGLAEVTIEAGDDVADAALVLGRALSQRIYIRYIQGLVENTNAVQLRYKLSDKWTIETESGTRAGAGADILYTLER